MAKKPASVFSLKNITFEARQLSEVLKENEEKRRTSIIEEARQKDEQRIFRMPVKGSRTIASYRGRSSKAKIWSDHKIRLEYGLMKKPFKSQWKNILWLIIFEGPLTVNEIIEHLNLDKSSSTISAAMSTFIRYLGPDNIYGSSFISRFKNERFVYTYTAFDPLEDLNDKKAYFDDACKAFGSARVQHSRAQADARRKQKEKSEQFDSDVETTGVTKDTPEIDEKHKKEFVHFPETPPVQEQEQEQKVETAAQLEDVLEKFIVAKLKELNVGRKLDLNINVSGKIKFRFGFGD